MPVAVEAAPISTLLKLSTPAPSASNVPALSGEPAPALPCVSVPPSSARSVPSFSISEPTVSEPETSVTPAARVRSTFCPVPKVDSTTVPVACSSPAFSTTPASVI